MGTTLIILGVLTILAGIILWFKPYKTDLKEKSDALNPDEKQSGQARQTASEANIQELTNLIKLAAADGVLTENESDLIYNRAHELGVDYKLVNELLSKEMKLREDNPETRLIDKYKEAGNAFEGYIASRFNRAFFTLKNWAGDKYYQGIYAETTVNPDLLLCFRMGNVEENFAVECKYRSYYYQDGVDWTKENQIDAYRRFEAESKMPVFIAIGVGGSPDNPHDLFLIPLREIEYKFLTKSYLMKYRKHDFREKNFFFDYNDQILK